jgi:hypothetical protein
MQVPDALVLNEVELMKVCSGKVGFVTLIEFLDTRSSFYLVHGINFRVICKWMRMSGVDHIHAGNNEFIQ